MQPVCLCVCVCGPYIIVIVVGAGACTEGPTRSLHRLPLASLLAAVLVPLCPYASLFETLQ